LPTGKFKVERTDTGNETLKAPVEFYWLQPNGSISPAPNTQVILYPQYPEIRLSGFLKGSSGAPNVLMNTREPGRLLFLGITRARCVIGWVSKSASRIGLEYRSLGSLEKLGVFGVVPLRAAEQRVSTRSALLREVRRIHRLDWIDSKALRRDGSIVECTSSHCVGYTLEAEFGIARNGISEPDFKGWELKATTVSDLGGKPSSKAITLMTPEPVGGFYRSDGVEAFIRKFGYVDKRGRRDRLNSGGVHIVGMKNAGTHLTLVLNGFDSKKERITNPAGSLALLSDRGLIAAEWSFAALMSLWNRKHAQAAYVPAEARTTPRKQYRYGGLIRLGEGADFVKLLGAFARGIVYYDPGIKLEGATAARSTIKRRSQFRIKSNQLSAIYSRMEDVLVA
jgi:hypothetical protein